jgi:tRNA threonylcarbamoyl adenosine modification protein (Sua5/YciO/YrdC/YwlC family)
MNQLLVEAVRVLAAGGIVGLPTDTVYGLAVAPESEAAVARLFDLKHRPPGKPIALLAADMESAGSFVEITPSVREIVTRHWPGALTVILTPKRSLPAWVGHPATRSVGVRVPDHPRLRRLLELAGPLAVTSANLAGEQPAITENDARAVFADQVDLYLPGTSDGGEASTVIDMSTGTYRLVRPGPIDPRSSD